jgi:hypothetical protein
MQTTLGHVLLHVCDYRSGSTLYFPKMERYEADTQCLVVEEFDGTWLAQHQSNIQNGFENWLNLSVVSDVWDEVLETINYPDEQKQTEFLINAFNKELEKNGWLQQNINFIESKSKSKNYYPRN